VSLHAQASSTPLPLHSPHASGTALPLQSPAQSSTASPAHTPKQSCPPISVPSQDVQLSTG